MHKMRLFLRNCKNRPVLGTLFPDQTEGFTHSIWRLRALPPDPQWLPATGGSAPDPCHFFGPSIMNSWLRQGAVTKHQGAMTM